MKITDEEFKEKTIEKLARLEERISKVPQMEKDISDLKVGQAEILGILKGKETATSRVRANIALLIAVGVAVFGEAGSRVISWFK